MTMAVICKLTSSHVNKQKQKRSSTELAHSSSYPLGREGVVF